MVLAQAGNQLLSERLDQIEERMVAIPLHCNAIHDVVLEELQRLPAQSYGSVARVTRFSGFPHTLIEYWAKS